MSKLLNGSASIARAIKKLYSDSSKRRVALVAFVGADAEAFLPHPSGLELVCWDKPGCTDPFVIRSLLAKGATVSFVQNLHCKLYWALGTGAIVGSANLSANGLADGGLHELAVWVPDHQVDIELIRSQMVEVDATGDRLQELERQTRNYRSRNAGNDVFVSSAKARISLIPHFDEWLRESQHRGAMPDWRLEINDINFTGKEQGELVTNGYLTKTELLSDFWSGSKEQTEEGRWVLFMDYTDHNDVDWFCAGRQARVLRKDRALCAADYFAVQLVDKAKLGPQPFRLDSAFKKALLDFLDRVKANSWRAAERRFPEGRLTPTDLKLLGKCYVMRKSRSGSK